MPLIPLRIVTCVRCGRVMSLAEPDPFVCCPGCNTAHELKWVYTEFLAEPTGPFVVRVTAEPSPYEM